MIAVLEGTTLVALVADEYELMAWVYAQEESA